MNEPDHVETGLVGLSITAAVTPPEPTPEQLPAVIVPQVPAAEMPEGWTIHKTAAFVRDLAQNLYDEDTVLKKHGVSPEQYARLKNNEFFKRALEATALEWNAPQNTKRRLALESAIAIEDSLPDVVARMRVKNEPLTGVVALLKVLGEIAGVAGQGQAQQPQAVGEKFKITINLGGDVTQREATPNLVQVQSLSEREGEGSALQRLITTP